MNSPSVTLCDQRGRNTQFIFYCVLLMFLDAAGGYSGQYPYNTVVPMAIQTYGSSSYFFHLVNLPITKRHPLLANAMRNSLSRNYVIMSLGHTYKDMV